MADTSSGSTTITYFIDPTEDLKYVCKHCGKKRSQHAGPELKCLFNATTTYDKIHHLDPVMQRLEQMLTNNLVDSLGAKK